MNNKLMHNDTFNGCNLSYDVIKFSSRVPIASLTGEVSYAAEDTNSFITVYRNLINKLVDKHVVGKITKIYIDIKHFNHDVLKNVFTIRYSFNSELVVDWNPMALSELNEYMASQFEMYFVGRPNKPCIAFSKHIVRKDERQTLLVGLNDIVTNLDTPTNAFKSEFGILAVRELIKKHAGEFDLIHSKLCELLIDVESINQTDDDVITITYCVKTALRYNISLEVFHQVCGPITFNPAKAGTWSLEKIGTVVLMEPQHSTARCVANYLSDLNHKKSKTHDFFYRITNIQMFKDLTNIESNATDIEFTYQEIVEEIVGERPTPTTIVSKSLLNEHLDKHNMSRSMCNRRTNIRFISIDGNDHVTHIMQIKCSEGLLLDQAMLANKVLDEFAARYRCTDQVSYNIDVRKVEVLSKINNIIVMNIDYVVEHAKPKVESNVTYDLQTMSEPFTKWEKKRTYNQLEEAKADYISTISFVIVNSLNQKCQIIRNDGKIVATNNNTVSVYI